MKSWLGVPAATGPFYGFLRLHVVRQQRTRDRTDAPRQHRQLGYTQTMAHIDDEGFEDDLQAFLDRALGTDGGQKGGRLRTTLTFAQSVDGKIAGKNGEQLALSCRESMYMTHLCATLPASRRPICSLGQYASDA